MSSDEEGATIPIFRGGYEQAYPEKGQPRELTDEGLPGSRGSCNDGNKGEIQLSRVFKG